MPLNVTFAADADNDVINISYYINGRLNQTQLGNATLNASDGVYVLNVSLFDNVAGSASSANATVNFTINSTIDATAPVINLISPANNTGDSDGNISFFYNVTDTGSIANCSLIINKKINQTNSSITNGTKQNFTLISLESLPYNWSLNCSDSANNIGMGEERSISVILLNNFNYSTTDLSSVSINNITNFILGVSSYGKINFTQNVDLSGGININKNVNISFNRIEINSTALSALNKSASLILYGLSFSNPRILMDGDVCPSDICTKISYTGGNLIFNATHFTVYSSEETPTAGSSEGGSSGGGGGGGTVTPPEPTPQEEPLETTEVTKEPEATKVLFDAILDLIRPEITLGENLAAKVYLVNFGVPGRVNVTLYYTITDLENNTILTEEETMAVETQTEYIKTFELPSDIKAGEYELSVKLTYENQEAVSQNSFKIIPKEIKKGVGIALKIWVVAGIVVIFMTALAVILWKGNRLQKLLPAIKERIMKIRVKKGVKEYIAKRVKYLSPVNADKDKLEHLKEELKIRKPEATKYAKVAKEKPGISSKLIVSKPPVAIVAEKKAKTLSKFSLKKGRVLLIRDKNDRVSFSMFKDLTSVLPGLGVVRVNPSTLGYSKGNVKFIWLSESEGENCINPSDIEDLYNEILDFLKRQKEGIVLLQGIDYIISGTNFKTLLRILRMLKDEISSGNNLIIVSFNQDLLNKEEAEKLKSEFNVIQR